MKSRAQRRHDLNRMKAKAERVYPTNDPKTARTFANHLAACSCEMCGNPRKHFNEPTRQEKKAALKERDDA